MVREKSPVRGAQDCAAGGQGSRRLLSRARPGRIHQRRLHHSAGRPGELEQYRAVGTKGMDPQRKDLRDSARGVYRRTVLRQGGAEEARRRATRERPVHPGAVPGPGQEGSCGGHDARYRKASATAPIRGPTSPSNRFCASWDRTITRSSSPASCPSPTHVSSRFSSGSRSWSTPAPIRRTS